MRRTGLAVAMLLLTLSALAAAALGLSEADVRTSVHEPCVASVGLPFVIVEVTGADALRRARPDPDGLAALEAGVEAYDLFSGRRDGCIKAVLSPNG